MSDRKRVNISVDPKTYDRLQSLKKQYGYKNACELVVAFVHILIDRLEDAGNRKYDLPEDDGAYIDNMFEDLGHVQRTPDGTVPVRHNRKKIR
ncbi:hypothetical protein [Bacteroides acidifaciens]|uniref:Uncharacterized protein n=1 Tax=Bacteroides acidifaciens TaxID=85831 RepID=A0A4S2B022_9BACE|nr:hypothetical protein [Bacteroides acidifaciens]TGY07121.1 hypothetical protein E5356_05180 [Bacteroides acidifaciens]